MKRSEMIAILTGYLIDYKRDSDQLNYNSQELAEFILDCVEHKGMYMTEVQSLCDDLDLRVITYWEDENE